jgi:hypothetical protein
MKWLRRLFEPRPEELPEVLTSEDSRAQRAAWDADVKAIVRRLDEEIEALHASHVAPLESQNHHRRRATDHAPI